MLHFFNVALFNVALIWCFTFDIALLNVALFNVSQFTIPILNAASFLVKVILKGVSFYDKSTPSKAAENWTKCVTLVLISTVIWKDSFLKGTLLHQPDQSLERPLKKHKEFPD